jgi:hypothetical protein
MTSTNFRPLHDRVVVRRVESEAKTKGGIIIPDTAKEKPQEGEIVAVGTGTRDDKEGSRHHGRYRLIQPVPTFPLSIKPIGHQPGSF